MPATTPASVTALPFSTSTSLADGLVSRLLADWASIDAQFRADKLARVRRGEVSRLPSRRALGYRVLRERSLGLVPASHRLLEASHGDQGGLDKRAGFAVVHWAIIAEVRRLQVLVTYGRPGWTLPLRWHLATIACHALQRLFYRLKTVDEEVVLAELAAAVQVICAWYPVLCGVIEDAMSVGVPTPHGMLIVRRSAPSGRFAACELTATTWVSEPLIAVRAGQLAALREAREHQGLVLQVGADYLALTRERALARFAPLQRTRGNAFFAEMLRHLPLAGPLNSLVYGH